MVEVTPKETNFKKYTDKLTKIIKIILQLAQINGYDSSGRIKRKDLTFIDNSNLIELLNHAMLSSRVLIGENGFIQLLYQANVEPELIINDNVRVKLIQLFFKNQNDNSVSLKVTEEHAEIAKLSKRKYDIDMDDENVS